MASNKAAPAADGRSVDATDTASKAAASPDAIELGASKGRQAPMDAVAASSKLALLVFEDERLTGIVPLRGRCVSIGREIGCTVRVRDNAVSRRHCTMLSLGDHVLLNDGGSTNGTFVSGIRVTSAMLGEGDEITVGHVLLKLADLGAAQWDGHDDLYAELYVDPASGLLNRRGLRSRIDTSCAGLSEGSDLGLLLLHVDGAPGDGRQLPFAAAAGLGGALRSLIGEHGFAARLGTADFAVVVLGRRMDQLKRLAESLAADAEQVLARFDGKSGRGSVHVGGACAAVAVGALRRMFVLADDALHRARAQGLRAWVHPRRV